MPSRPKSRRLPCRVEFYAGGRAEETPRFVICRGRRLKVERLLESRRVLDAGSERLIQEFRVVLEGRRLELRSGRSGRWELVFSPDQAAPRPGFPSEARRPPGVRSRVQTGRKGRA